MTGAEGRSATWSKVCLGVACLLAVYAWIMNAWLGDDAFITFRTAQNLAEGFGPRWNPHERVQTYTHPLWMLLVSLGFRITGEFYFTVLTLSLCLTACAIFVALRRVDADRGTLALALLLTSKAFFDYTSSGLENPLAYLCLGLFANTRSATGRAWLASAVFLTRNDLALLIAPALIVSAWQERRTLRWRSLWVAFTPVVAWAFFAIVYYGFFFPNTAYAKLGTGVSRTALMRQGCWYFVNSVRWDFPTLSVLALSLIVLVASKDAMKRATALGIALYLGYIVWIGGDFMTGRFFAAPLFFGVVSALASLSRVPGAGISLALALVVSFLAPLAPLKTTREYRGHLLGWDHGITDERGLYWRKDTGLIFWGMRGPLPMHPNIEYARDLSKRGETVVVEGVIGFLGWAGGRDITVIDPLGLGDPLLARLKLVPGDWWGVGHYPRRIPEGYVESVRSGTNRIADPSLAQYYEKLRIVTSDPIWSRKRWNTIFEAHRGSFDAWLDEYLARQRPKGT